MDYAPEFGHDSEAHLRIQVKQGIAVILHYCDGEFDSPISSQTFEYSNGKLDFQDVEEEEDEDDDWDE